MKYIAYYRVSTEKQGRSGLGLEAQQAAVEAFVTARAGELIAPPFVEVESGKRADNRPELAKALAACKKHHATLLVAKLDRLARNVSFIATLLESGVDVVAVDMPEANRFMLHVMAAVAEHERQAISDRTKAALAAAKARGVKLGNPTPSSDTTKARTANKAAAAERHSTYGPLIAELAAQGLSLRKIAGELEARGIESPRGKVAWSASMVKNFL